MDIERIIKTSEILLEKAAHFDHEAKEEHGRSLAWNKEGWFNRSEAIMRSAVARANTATMLQESVWWDLQDYFVYNRLDLDSNGVPVGRGEELDIIIRSEIMDYYKKIIPKSSK